MLRFNGPIYRFMLWMARLAALNILFWVSALPIVTAFPAAVAMSSVASKWVQGDSPSLIREYVTSFKRHFVKSFTLGLLYVAIILVLGMDFQAMLRHPGQFEWVTPVVTIIGFLVTMMMLYTSCIIGRLDGPIRLSEVLNTSFRVGVFKVHITVLHIFTIAGLFYLALHFSFLNAFFTFSIASWINAWYVEFKFRELQETKTTLTD